MNRAHLDMEGENGEIHVIYLTSQWWTILPFTLVDPLPEKDQL